MASGGISPIDPSYRVGVGTSAPNPFTALDVRNASGIGLNIRTAGGAGEKPLLTFQNPQGQVRAMFSSEGQYYTNGFMTISGGFKASLLDNGLFSIANYGAMNLEPNMLEISSDVGGPAMMIRSSSDAGSYIFAGLDVAKNYRLIIANDGGFHWGATTKAALDTDLYRSNVSELKTDGALVVGGTSQVDTLVTGTNPGTPLCADAHNRLCRCGQCE